MVNKINNAERRNRNFQNYLRKQNAYQIPEIKYSILFPEKTKSRYATSKLPKLPGKLMHHWSYNEEHWGDIIYLTKSEHTKVHHHMNYDQEHMKFRRPDGALLNTKEEHIEYIHAILI